MVYLGPITRLVPLSKPKPATGYEPDRDLVIDSELPEHRPPVQERRRGDRRRQDRAPMLDSRTGRDRRRNRRPTIDIEV